MILFQFGLSHCVLQADQAFGQSRSNKEVAIRNRLVFRLRCALMIGTIVAPPPAAATELRTEAVQGFEQYLRLTERRMQGELAPGGAFLWVDALAEPRR